MNGEVLRDSKIVCFGGEQWEYPGFQQVVMRHLSANNRILYVNALGLRKAAFKGKNANIYFAKLKRLFAGARKVSDTITVFNPFFLPVLYSKYVDKVNKVLLRWQFRRLLQDLKFTDYLLWAGTPTVAPFLGLFEPRLLIYNPVDRYFAFSFVDRAGVQKYESIVASAADLVIATADGIKEDMAHYNGNCDVVSHGVLFDHFNKATRDLPVPHDLNSVKRPVIGFFGSLSEWVDLELVGKVALQYSDASIVLVGRVSADVSLFHNIPNLFVLGFREFDTLPAYLRMFDVCIIPFRLTELVDAVDPIKLREYLCAGKPVVTTNFREARKFGDLIYIGRSHDEFLDAVGHALTERDSNLVQDRISRAREDDWPNKIHQISSFLLQALNGKNSGTMGREWHR
jgi:glycosyltransferase involved in cell wall biosynthesis